MNFTSLSYFSVVAEELNFSRAASRLFLSQQALSKSIRQLEKELGTPLFFRRRTLELTDAGRCVLEFAQEACALKHRLETRLAALESDFAKSLSVGVPADIQSFLLPDVLALGGLMGSAPSIRFVTGTSDELAKMLHMGQVELCLDWVTPEDREFDVQPLADDAPYLVISGSLLKSLFPTCYFEMVESISDVADPRVFACAPFLLPSNCRMRESFDRYMARFGLAPPVAAESVNQRLLLSLAHQGAGVAIVSGLLLELMPPALPTGAPIYQSPIRLPEFEQRLALLRVEHSDLSPEGLWFSSLCRQYAQDIGRKAAGEHPDRRK